MRRYTCLLSTIILLFLFVSMALAETGVSQKNPDFITTETLQPIQDEETLKILREVQERVEKLRGIRHENPIPAFYLDSETLKQIVTREVEKQYPEERRQAIEAMMKSLALIPDDFNLLKMLLPLLDEQVGGLYDVDTKKLFVRKGYDIANSGLARLILAHEICHALQDHEYDLKSLGIESTDNDDAAVAGLTIAEGDATVLTNEYAASYIGSDILKEAPAMAMMDQSALQNTPYFFRQQLLFPYLQGEAFVQEALERNPEWREKIFVDPPQTTEQVIHPDLYFETRDIPSSLTLLSSPDSFAAISKLSISSPPESFQKLELNRMGELGIRLILEERLGSGIAFDAAAGWDGDAYLVYGNGAGKWWFCWETAWDSAGDAEEFAGAWITFWRSIADNKKLGELKAEDQEFKTGSWTIQTRRSGDRVVMIWRN